MQIGDLKVGDMARILAIREPETPYARRLMALGCLPGAVVTVIRRAPLGDPVEIILRGASLCLRQDEASILDIEKIEEVVA